MKVVDLIVAGRGFAVAASICEEGCCGEPVWCFDTVARPVRRRRGGGGGVGRHDGGDWPITHRSDCTSVPVVPVSRYTPINAVAHYVRLSWLLPI
jgi:hypothetical protein